MGEPVVGHLARLDDTRLVFVGCQDDTFFIGFRNSDGEDTKLKISHEAFDALIWLRAKLDIEVPVTEFPVGEKLKWHWVVTRAEVIDHE